MAKMNGIKKNTMFLLGRTWRKLHLVIDENHQVLACELSTPELDDPTAPLALATLFDTFISDGAYDSEPVSQAVLGQQPDPDAQVVIPPHKNGSVRLRSTELQIWACLCP